MSDYNHKYEITDIAHEKYPFLCRIRALRDIGSTVKAGDLGGFVEYEGNLSFESPDDDSWIFHDAIAANAACVEDGSILRDHAVVCGEARIRGESRISDDAWVGDHAVIDGAWVELYSKVSAHALVTSRADDLFPVISGESVVYGIVSGRVLVTDMAVVLGDEKIVNETVDRLVLTEQGRSVERDRSREVILPSARYFGRKKALQAAAKKPKRKEAER